MNVLSCHRGRRSAFGHSRLCRDQARRAEFTLESRGEFTNVTWTILGPVPYVMKVMCIFFSMDKMLGKDFETGLSNMKAIAEN
jgi:hypothetical protein